MSLEDQIKVKTLGEGRLAQTVVEISGEVVFKGPISGPNVTSDGNILANNMITSRGDMKCEKNLAVQGDMNCTRNMDVKGVINCAGDINLLNADCAEEFEVLSKEVEPGTVMILGNNGTLEPCRKSYDKRVAGIISGAGGFKPGLIMDKHEETQENRAPIALMGKVYCKVDADHSSVEVGDLLTTSSTMGHAMKATDPLKGFGTVIGKALGQLVTGRGLIPVLVALQ